MAWATEADLEQVFMDDLGALGYALHRGADISPDVPHPLRQSFRDTLLEPVFLAALARLNPALPTTAINEAASRLRDIVFTTDVVQENRRVHDLMISGIALTYFANGEERNARVQVVDWNNALNDWRAVNQVDVVGKNPRIPDVVLFLNGLPLAVIELKGTEGADTAAAYNQIDTYKEDIPDLFRTSLLNVISDGITARYGSLSAGLDRYMSWRTLDGETIEPVNSALALQTLTNGLLKPEILLEMLRWFVVFEDEGRIIATELVVTMRSNTGTDWWRRENVRAKMRVAVKKLLQMHGYPPDLAPAAIKLILKQAEALAAEIRYGR